MVKCCYKCQERTIGCHGSCETYKREVKEHRQEKAETEERQKAYNEYKGYLVDRGHNRRKYARRERKR